MSNWTKTSEELPPEGIEVIVRSRLGVNCAKRLGDKYRAYGWDLREPVTDWMHMPKFPELEENVRADSR